MKDYLISPGLQNALVYSSNDTMKTMSNVDKVNFKDVLHTTEYYNCKPKKVNYQAVKNILERNPVMKV